MEEKAALKLFWQLFMTSYHAAVSVYPLIHNLFVHE